MNKVLGNLEALQREIAASDLDALVTITPENVPYCSGVLLWTSRTIRDRLGIVLWPREGPPTFIVASQEEGYVRDRTWIQDVRGYVQHQSSPIQVLAETLREKGLAAGRLGIELSYLSVDFHKELTESAPEAQLVPCESLLQRVRMVKTPGEIELLARAAVATERALMATYATIRPGDREHDLVARLGGNIIQSGADIPAFLHLTTGPNSGYAHPDPTDYRVQPGDLVKSDCGGLYSGYYSDVARTAVVGKATPEQRSIYQRLMEVHRNTIATMNPGTLASDVHRTAVQEYQRVEIPFAIAFAGHSVGLSVHEPPMLSAYDNTPLEPNMMFYVETRVRWPGKAGYHIEDLVHITEQGPKIITTFMDTSDLMEL